MIPDSSASSDVLRDIPYCLDIDGLERMQSTINDIDKYRISVGFPPYECFYDYGVFKFRCKIELSEREIVNIIKTLISSVEPCLRDRKPLVHAKLFEHVAKIKNNAEEKRRTYEERSAMQARQLDHLKNLEADSMLFVKKQEEKMNLIKKQAQKMSAVVEKFHETLDEYESKAASRPPRTEIILLDGESELETLYEPIFVQDMLQDMLLLGLDSEMLYSLACSCLLLVVLTKRVPGGERKFIGIFSTFLFSLRTFAVHRDLAGFTAAFATEMLVGHLIVGVMSALWDVLDARLD